jgi:mgtE-like transporter
MASITRPASNFLRYLRAEKRTLVQGYIALFISSGGDLLAGLALSFMNDSLQKLSGLIVLIPAAIGMRGNIFGALGSRLGTGIHSGQFSEGKEGRTFLWQNVLGSAYLTLATCLFLGVAAHLISNALGSGGQGPPIPILSFVTISILGGVLGSVVVGGLSVVIALLSHRRSWDLDSVSAPLVTAIGDIATLPALWLASIYVQHVPSVVPATGWIVGTACLIGTIIGLRSSAPLVRRIVRESMPILFLAGSIDLFAGAVLENRLNKFLALPALLILVPPFLEDTNALSGILASRLGSKLHVGVIDPTPVPQREAWLDILINFMFGFSVFFMVGFSSNVVAVFTHRPTPGFVTMIVLSLLAGFLATIFSCAIAYFAAVGTFRFGWDPDNHSIPVSSAVMDLAGTLCLVLVILLLGLHG